MPRVSGAIAATTLSCLFLSATANALGPIDGKVYGRLNVTYQYEDNADSDGVWKLENNSSRLGFKGETAIDSGLNILYQLEFGVEVDDGEKDGDTFSQRDIFLGLEGSWGQLKAGRLTIPFKQAKGDFDRFNDLQGELGKIIDGENRLSNTLQYASPELLTGLVAKLAVIPGEGEGDEDDAADAASASLVYKREQLYLALAVNNNIKQQDQLRLVTTWHWGALGEGLFSVGALYQHSKGHDDDFRYIDGKDEADAYGGSAVYALRKNSVKVQYIVSDRSARMSDSSQFSVALDHQLGERSVLYTYYADRKADEREYETRYLAVGLKHSF
ncbi:putative porin [Sinobacterium caligoides]|uniref:Putative porin n=1 Tax=Sinobacterium caligoides TaxID=933926 RepID=A0A3N2E1D5_9GAMM|nr:porin [Sinobacterium caligoides]ROS05459.1 putative porin [Sinobacterium caligoides]